jgi:hypothetical protein
MCPPFAAGRTGRTGPDAAEVPLIGGLPPPRRPYQGIARESRNGRKMGGRKMGGRKMGGRKMGGRKMGGRKMEGKAAVDASPVFSVREPFLLPVTVLFAARR